jgi:hypothetical protein
MEVHRMKRGLFLFFIYLALALLTALPAWAESEYSPIDDDEEYRVFAAVLFPSKPEIPDEIKNDPLKRDMYRLSQPDLDGLDLNSTFMTVQETTRGQKIRPDADGSDASLIEDFNRKNEKSARIVKEKLAVHLPKAQSVHIITREEMAKLFRGKGGWEEYRRRFPLSGGIKTFSCVGFNPSRTRAAVFIRHQADYEMGIGYVIYLDKSATSGQWIMTASVLAYRS